MKIGGLQKLTLIDYPGKVAATLFTAGCNFRCHFCHNPELVLISSDWEDVLSEKDFFHFLEKRKGKLDGICITGGEPTLQPDLLSFVAKIKKKGFLVKIDSNGTRPDVLEEGLKEELFDFVAMDIKNSLTNYSNACGIKIDMRRIKKSVNLIMDSGVDYEFRTTVVPGIHHYKDFTEIGKWLKGAKKFVLQQYRNEGKILNHDFAMKTYKKKLDLKRVKKDLSKYFEKIEIR